MEPMDWTAFRALAHELVDALVDRHQQIHARKAFHPPSGRTKEILAAPIPDVGLGERAAVQLLLDRVLPHTTGIDHPHFLGWASGSGTALGAMARMFADSNAFGGNQAATVVEGAVLDWVKKLLRQPDTASALLTGGASHANLLALMIAGAGRVHSTTRAHTSIHKAARLIDGANEVVVATAGDVVTGTFDDLHALADQAEARAAWFHVDAALGLVAALSPRQEPRLDGIERADSVAFDLHKWAQASPGVGGLIVRDAARHKRTFTEPSAYLGAIKGGLGGSNVWFAQLGLEHTRPFRALEPWLVLTAYGTDGLRRSIEASLERAHDFATALVHHGIEVVSNELGIVLFDVDQRRIGDLTQRGVAVFSPAEVDGRPLVRAAFVGHRTARADVEALARAVT